MRSFDDFRFFSYSQYKGDFHRPRDKIDYCGIKYVGLAYYIRKFHHLKSDSFLKMVFNSI